MTDTRSTPTVSIAVPMEDWDVIDAIEAIAEKEERSRSRVIVRALRFFLLHYGSVGATIQPAEQAEVTE